MIRDTKTLISNICYILIDSMSLYENTSVTLSTQSSGTVYIYLTIPTVSATDDIDYYTFKTTMEDVYKGAAGESETLEDLMSPTDLFGSHVLNASPTPCDCCGTTDIESVDVQVKCNQHTTDGTLTDSTWELLEFCVSCSHKFEQIAIYLVSKKYPEYFVAHSL